jgi:hypothetical protein
MVVLASSRDAVLRFLPPCYSCSQVRPGELAIIVVGVWFCSHRMFFFKLITKL